MQKLDTLSFPLTGASLIEASAGTGKTYTIVNLYLRLLLGHQCRAHSVEEILVVTFTKAATAELKSRVRQKLSATYIDFIQGKSDDPVVSELIAQSGNVSEDCKRLSLALRQMDEAAIFTIHSFCQRTLSEHAFESGVMYDQSLIMDESEWLSLAAEDYWRKFIVPLEGNALQLLVGIWDSPHELMRHVRPFVHRRVQIDNLVSVEQAMPQLGVYAQRVRAIKKRWLRGDIASTLLAAGLKKNTKLGKPAVYQQMEVYCQGESILPPLDQNGWLTFSPLQLAKALPKGKTLDAFDGLRLEEFEELHTFYQFLAKQLKIAFSSHACEHIKRFLNHHKDRLNLLSPDDLLARVESVLTGCNGMTLAKALRNQYPAVLIDEFQDTDPAQFSLFNQVYIQALEAQESHDVCLIMIGDPKQAIYAFRGADIFTYIQAKQLLSNERHFTLGTNWRSQASLVNAINCLFTDSPNGFMFDEEIPFVAVQAARKEVHLGASGNVLPSLEFQVLANDDEKPLSWSQAHPQLAAHTAEQIAKLLLHGKLAESPVKAGDCCVLVRDREEAGMIKSALSQRGIASVFLIRKSVFATQTSADLYLLLNAIASPSDERHLKAALATDLFAFDADELDALIGDELAWQTLIDQCFYWQKVWQQQGVMLMISQVSEHFSLHQKLVSHYEDGLRRITDLRHLSELLQHQSQQTPSESQIINWYGEQIFDPDHDNEGLQVRLETDANLVQIVTMHASKGLEYPLVFVPFGCRFRASKEAIYHGEDKALRVDFSAEETPMEKAEYERLAEDIRLLYVAVTRAVYYCSIGIWDPQLSHRRGVSAFYQCALGALLSRQAGSSGNALFSEGLKDLNRKADVGWQYVDGSQLTPYIARQNEGEADAWDYARLSQPIKRNWTLTSYSAISRLQTLHHAELPGRDEGVERIPLIQPIEEEPQQDNPFNFVKGAQAGSFLHGVLENIEFQQPQNLAEVIEQQGTWFGIEEKWFPMVHDWVLQVLEAPFVSRENSVRLSDLTTQQCLPEMEFHMPLVEVKAQQFNQIINQFHPEHPRQYDFEKLNGMLKGFIDLTFEYQGKYYVADYKSNYLGNMPEDYQSDKVKVAMEEHDYHLQAILYVLALHRWLKLSLPEYQYHSHIGGAYYLFLRGMDPSCPGNGVYHTLPDYSLIERLDNLFAGKDIKPKETEGEQLGLW